MKDNTFLKISLAWSLIGLFALLLLAYFSQPQTIKISDMEQNVGKSVVLFGTVESASYKDKASFIEISDETGNTTAVLFENPTNKTKAGDRIGVKGKVQFYKNNFELVADEIRCVKC
jgi:aspartyl/asparaginyl-tRNA synthetase